MKKLFIAFSIVFCLFFSTLFAVTPSNTEQTSTETKEKSTKALKKAPAKKLNINTAAEKDFTSIPGIGPKTAQRIMEYRKDKKSFSKVEDLMAVKGIGKKKFEKIKDYITLE